MATMQGNQGQSSKAVGANQTAGFGEFSEVLITQLMARYYQQNYRGNTYLLSAAAAAGTAYTGAAGGTPLLGLWNPAGSGKNLVLKFAQVTVLVAASAAGNVPFRLYGGPTAAVTGTLTTPTSGLTLQTGGSVAKGIVNTAATSSTALAYLASLGTYYWATAAAAFLAPPLMWDFAGSIIVPPGCMLGMGAVTIPTSMTNDATLIWDEVAA